MEEKEKEFALLVFSQLLIIGTLCVQCLVVPDIQSMNICFRKIINRFDQPNLWSSIPFQEVVQCSATLSLYKKRLGV